MNLQSRLKRLERLAEIRIQQELKRVEVEAAIVPEPEREPEREPELCELSDEELRQRIIALGGTPEDLSATRDDARKAERFLEWLTAPSVPWPLDLTREEWEWAFFAISGFSNPQPRVSYAANYAPLPPWAIDPPPPAPAWLDPLLTRLGERSVAEWREFGEFRRKWRT